jgi:hypothetical protein
MATEQAAFDFSQPILPEIGEVERLLAHLSARPGFHTARQLSAALDLSDRKIRQLAEAADGLIVSGPGSPGYCHLYHCSSETIGHITATQISQAKHMIRRAIRTRRRAHTLISSSILHP